MAKPSKLKRAIKEMEDEIAKLQIERTRLNATISDKMSTIETLRKIDNEKNNKD